MHFPKLFALSLIPVALSCTFPRDEAPSNSTEFPKFTVGTDGPAEPATQGFFVNHFSLIVSNLTATRQFYGDVLGMRHIFTYDASKDYSIMYMGHAQGGRSGTGFQTGEELIRDKNNLGGLVEFVQLKTQKEKRKFNPTPSNTFSHIGLIVPDINAAQARFESMGVEIVKRVGELPSTDPNSPQAIIAKAFGIEEPDTEEAKDALAGVAALGFGEFIVIADPDGNLFEVQQFAGNAI
ncbi:hypothetical protein VNI00_007207 [Paramarasmius palmivorus]|uniref:VOC domain-containing protein n=1 Tax=Paramarasmius palmivorus TaxID=297713 RepID=A0AAW0D571_9AGAR